MVRRVCSCDAHSDIAQRVRPKSDVRRVRKRHVEAIVSPQADETPVCCFFFFYLYIYILSYPFCTRPITDFYRKPAPRTQDV